MTTDTEALRTQFERDVTDAAPFPVERDGDSYVNRFCAWAWEGYQAGHAAGMDGSPIIGFVADIRAAAGDPLGKLDWDELVTHIAGLHAAKAETAAAVAAERNRCADLLQRKAEALESLPATALAFSMMADAIRAGAKEPSDG